MSSLSEPNFSGISHVLLDIEGTTCPVDFVSGTLFPFASARLGSFLESNAHDSAISALLSETEILWRQDGDPEAQALWRARNKMPPKTETGVAVLPYLEWLISRDRKSAPLKELQGMVWREGYTSGEIIAPLFEDVPGALQRWREQGLMLAVYSSGSVEAQKLLYRFSNAGDLSGLFNHWFDTRWGSKRESDSYQQIGADMGAGPPRVLFISDVVEELAAASCAGMKVLFSRRKDNPQQDPGTYPWVNSFNHLVVTG